MKCSNRISFGIFHEGGGANQVLKYLGSTTFFSSLYMQVSLNFLFIISQQPPTSISTYMTIPVATASVERSFSQMKMIKTRLRNLMGEKSLSHLMKISIQSPERLSDSDLEILWMCGVEE